MMMHGIRYQCIVCREKPLTLYYYEHQTFIPPFPCRLAGFVSCDEFKPEVAVGCVTVDNEYSCALTSAIGGDIRPFAKFVISILRQNDFL